MNFKDYSLNDFSQILASPTPTPGGGGAASLSASIGISLGGMVASLTAVNIKYADVADEMKEIEDKCDKLRLKFLDFIEEDAMAYEPLSKAYKMPKNNDDQIIKRNKAIANSLKNACETPLEIMKTCCEAIDILEILAEKGSKMLISDVGAGLMLMRSALNTASINVFINLKSMKDEKNKLQIKNECNTIINEYTQRADLLYNKIIVSIS